MGNTGKLYRGNGRNPRQKQNIDGKHTTHIVFTQSQNRKNWRNTEGFRSKVPKLLKYWKRWSGRLYQKWYANIDTLHIKQAVNVPYTESQNDNHSASVSQ